jgi:F-type H+-transporting ATPase subunit b
MPQFDPSSFPSQIFWLAVSFIALYLVVSRLAVPRIAEVLEQRHRLVQDDIDRAAALKAETDQAIAAYEQAMAEARAQAQEQIRIVTNEAKAIAEKRTAEVTAAVNDQITQAEARIARARQDALDSLKQVAADNAKAVVAKLTNLSPDDGAVQTAVATALKETR